MAGRTRNTRPHIVMCLGLFFIACGESSNPSLTANSISAGQSTSTAGDMTGSTAGGMNAGGQASMAAEPGGAPDLGGSSTEQKPNMAGASAGGMTAKPSTAGAMTGPEAGSSSQSGGSMNTCIPSPEACNGLDDDCDEVVDEEIPQDPMPCDTGAMGACAMGQSVCQDGSFICENTVMPMDDVCDGVDNDCDGETDEAFMPAPCETGVPGRCADGTTECVDGQSSCQAMREMTLESCNDIDDDCDGTTDETFINLGLGQACTSGRGICARDGVNVCTAGGGGIECGAVAAPNGAEVCNSLDDDCDGDVDEEIGLGDICRIGMGRCVAEGVQVCAEDGTLRCDANFPNRMEEVCNNTDDDCDGRVDEGFNVGEACRLTNNICDLGINRCRFDGSVACIASATILPGQPQDERCNGLDDDCDGGTDEGNPQGGQACVTQLEGACRMGERVCDMGRFPCLPVTRNTPEICNGLDEDCDGRVDENIPQVGQNCTPEQTEELLGWPRIGCARTARFECQNAVPVCVPDEAPADECNGRDDDCDGRVDESEPVQCATGENGQCSVGAEICENGQPRCVPSAEPECETANNRNDEDCDGRTDEAPGAVAECAPPDTQLTRVCLGEAFASHNGFSMLMDGDDIVFARAQTLNENLYFSRLSPDGTTVDELIHSRVMRFPDRLLKDTDLIAFNGQYAVCYRKFIGDDFYVAVRQADGSWQKEMLLEDTDAGVYCRLGMMDGQLVTAYTRDNQLWFAVRRGANDWVHEAIDTPNGTVGSDLDMVIYENVPYIAHRDDTQGRLRLTHRSRGVWSTMIGPPSNGAGDDGMPDPDQGSGFRPAIAASADGVHVLHGIRPQQPDRSGDAYILMSRTTMPPDGRFLTEFVSGQDGFGGGQAVTRYGDGFIIFARYRFVSALFANVYRLMTFKTTDRTISRILPGDNFDGANQHTYTRLAAAIDTYGLPVYGFVGQNAGRFEICFYRPTDTDGDGVPDAAEIQMGTNPNGPN